MDVWSKRIFYNTLDSENSHEETNGMVGDIIVYFNHENEPIHSGIVVKTIAGTSNGVCGDADLKIVQSKWGDLGLYTLKEEEASFTT